jgi:NADPH2:quinone reductase
MRGDLSKAAQMKAIRVSEFGGPEVLHLQEIPAPEPGAGQVLVKMQAAGVNPVDTYIRGGAYGRLPDLPYTPGFDGSGIIDAVGQGVPLQKGMRVYLSGSLTGTYAEFALCTPAQIHPLPDHLSFAQGAALGIPYATAEYALFHRGGAKAGETVLIQGGTGGVGLAAVELARAAGLTVLATGGSAEGRALATERGAHAVFDHSAPDYLEQIHAATSRRGVALILEMLANRNLAADLSLLAPAGRVVVIGSRGPIEINPRDIMIRNADVRGVMLFAMPPAELSSVHGALQEKLQSRIVQPVIGREFRLGEAAVAHRAIMEGGAAGKIILRLAGL